MAAQPAPYGQLEHVQPKVVGAIAVGHYLADQGYCDILAVVHNTGFAKGIGGVSVINNWYNRSSSVKLGAYKGVWASSAAAQSAVPASALADSAASLRAAEDAQRERAVSSARLDRLLSQPAASLDQDEVRAAKAAAAPSVVQLLIEQAETADVLVLNKVDGVDDAQRGYLEAALGAINGFADILPTTFGKVQPTQVLLTEREAGVAASPAVSEQRTIAPPSSQPLHPLRLLRPEQQFWSLMQQTPHLRLPFHRHRVLSGAEQSRCRKSRQDN